MSKSSQLLGKSVVWNTCARKPWKTCRLDMTEKLLKTALNPNHSINRPTFYHKLVCLVFYAVFNIISFSNQCISWLYFHYYRYHLSCHWWIFWNTDRQGGKPSEPSLNYVIWLMRGSNPDVRSRGGRSNHYTTWNVTIKRRELLHSGNIKVGIYETVLKHTLFSRKIISFFIHRLLDGELSTISHIQQIWSRRLWKLLGKNTETLYKCRYYYWKELKTLWQKNKLLVLSNFYFCHNVFKSRLLQMRQKSSECGTSKVVTTFATHLDILAV